MHHVNRLGESPAQVEAFAKQTAFWSWTGLVILPLAAGLALPGFFVASSVLFALGLLCARRSLTTCTHGRMRAAGILK